MKFVKISFSFHLVLNDLPQPTVVSTSRMGALLEMQDVAQDLQRMMSAQQLPPRAPPAHPRRLRINA